MAKNINYKKPVLFGVFTLAVLGSLSSLPGAMDTVHSADLLSNKPLYLNNCPVGDDVGAEGISECRIVNANKVSANVTIEKVVLRQAAPAPAAGTVGAPAPGKPIERYKVISTLEADFCADGSCSLERTVSTLDEAVRLGREFSETLSKEAKTKMAAEKTRLARIEKCETTEDGTEITNEAKALKCLADKLKEMDPEKAADYYADNLKERIQKLLQSNSPNDRALGMGALGEIGKKMNINCASRPGINQQAVGGNPYLNNSLLNPAMNPMRPVSTAGSKPGSPRDLIAESACDMWAFGTYNNNVEYLQLAAAQPGADRNALNNAMRTLKTGWGQYFQQRGLALQADPLGLNGMSGDLYNDVIENGEKVNANLQAIVDRHKDLLIQPMQTPNADQPVATGRMARGGIQPQNPVGAGTPSVNPWPVGTGAPVNPGRPTMQPAQPARFTGAPRMGAPVGPAVAPGAPAPALRR